MEIDKFNSQVNQLIADTTAAAFGKASTPKKSHTVIYSSAFEDIMKAAEESMEGGKALTQRACQICNASDVCTKCNVFNTYNAAYDATQAICLFSNVNI